MGFAPSPLGTDKDMSLLKLLINGHEHNKRTIRQMLRCLIEKPQFEVIETHVLPEKHLNIFTPRVRQTVNRNIKHFKSSA